MKVDYAKREAELKERCDNMPELPEDFYSWSETVFGVSWCFYKRSKSHAELFCCKCGERYRVRTHAKDSYEGVFEKIHEIPVHDHLGTCEKCGAAVQYKSGVTRAEWYEDVQTVLVGQKYGEGGYVLREIKVYRAYGKNKKNDFSYTEKLRSFYIPGKLHVQEDWNKHDWYNGADYWDYTGFGGIYGQSDHFGYIYPGTYRAMKGTCVEFSMMKQFFDKQTHPYYRRTAYFNNVRNYLNVYFRYPLVEVLVKMDAIGLVENMQGTWRTNLYHINNRAKTPYGMLRVKKHRFKQIVEKDSSGLLEWYQHEAVTEPIEDEVIEFFYKNRISVNAAKRILQFMTPKKAMNYLKRQKEEQYGKYSIAGVLSQYNDYIEMIKKLGKDLKDEMNFKPRELKRRHDEAVANLERQKAKIKAEEYSKKYSDAEKVLEKIRGKFEYAGSSFFIKVPERIVDIVVEGSYLHHCAGSTDRYFDRIKNNETYICFLRKNAEPDTPFYTIEVEPGGTIRQHRGMFDEEPELEAVKPFLIEWQGVIRERMTDRDKELAAVSKRTRQANIEELQAKNNTKVLAGLMEDFMEAEAI